MTAATVTSATMMRRQAIPLTIVLLSALLLRAGMFAVACYNAPDRHTLYTGDTATYVTPAKLMLADGTFSDGDGPEIYRTPGYPLLLAAGLIAGHMDLVTVGVQTVLSLASIALVYHLAWKLTANSTAALAASVLTALEPLSIIFTSFLMPETLFTFLLLASLSLLLHYLRTSSALALLAAALVLAAATFVRPITYYLPLAFMSLIALRALIGHGAIPSAPGATVGRRKRALGCLAAIAFGVVAIAPCAAWQVRNQRVIGYSGFTGIPECNLYFFQAASILARESGKTIQQVQVELGQNDPRLLESLHGPDQAATIRRLGAQARRVMAEHPVDFAKIQLRGMVIWLLDPGGSDLLSLLGLYPNGGLGIRPLNTGIVAMFGRMHRDCPELLYATLTMAAILGLLYCAAALGLVASRRRFDWQWFFVLTLVAYFWALSGGATGIARLRQPIMPLVCVMAGMGVACLVASLGHMRRSARESTATLHIRSARNHAVVQRPVFSDVANR